MMTHEEQEQLIGDGWSARLVNELWKRGFRQADPIVNPDGSRTPSFLRQTEHPHIHVALEKCATLETLDTAILEAGIRFGHESLAGLFTRFSNSCKSWRLSPAPAALESQVEKLTARLVRLEALMTNQNINDVLSAKDCADAAADGDYDQLLPLAVEMADALERSYNANEWPADGSSKQEQAAKAFREWQNSRAF